ncbi:hypothetical protein LINPERPRIM_LOCUS6388 [Linum perenne]
MRWKPCCARKPGFTMS